MYRVRVFVDSTSFSFWSGNHTRSPENFKGPGSVSSSGASLRCVAPVSSSWGCNPSEGSPEGVPFSEASSRAKRGSAERRKRGSGAPPSEARFRRAKRGSAERSEAVPPSEARLHRAKRGSTEAPPSEARLQAARRRSSGGRHYKKTQKGSTRKPRNHL